MNIDQTTLYRHIGTAIRKHREARGMTQAQLASAVGLLRTSIVNLEAGRQRAPLHTLYPICAALGIEATDVLPTVGTVLSEDQFIWPIDGIEQVVPARTAAFVSGLRGDQQEQDDI
jgi:transcriptional regulator with XRE-family HTH domain